MKIDLVNGSILEAKTEVIVNPANNFLRHGGGLARVIEQAATSFDDAYDEEGNSKPPKLVHEIAAKVHRWQEDHEKARLIATGSAYVTSAGVLPFQAVIHVVGPIWGGGAFAETRLLNLAASEIYNRCHDHGWNSVAVPAISCGIFGFPVELAAKILTDQARLHSWCHTVFYVMGDEHYEAFEQALE